jgi:hypothetical protein
VLLRAKSKGKRGGAEVARRFLCETSVASGYSAFSFLADDKRFEWDENKKVNK